MAQAKEIKFNDIQQKFERANAINDQDYTLLLLIPVKSGFYAGVKRRDAMNAICDVIDKWYDLFLGVIISNCTGSDAT